MRPQRNAAENLGDPSKEYGDGAASMRPQRNAAENAKGMPVLFISARSFNEAAA